MTRSNVPFRYDEVMLNGHIHVDESQDITGRKIRGFKKRRMMVEREGITHVSLWNKNYVCFQPCFTMFYCVIMMFTMFYHDLLWFFCHGYPVHYPWEAIQFTLAWVQKWRIPLRLPFNGSWWLIKGPRVPPLNNQQVNYPLVNEEFAIEICHWWLI